MVEWLRDLLAFFGAALRQWGVIVTGGVVVGLIGFYEHFSKRSITGWPLRITVLLSLFAAFFLAWRKEREQQKRLRVTALSATPRELCDVFKGRTAVQGEILAATYKNEWLRVSGSLDDVTVHKSILGYIRSVHVMFALAEPAIHMTFDRKWAKRLSILKYQERITVAGEIDEVTRYAVRLKRCELIEASQGN